MLYVPPYAPDLFDVLAYSIEEAEQWGHDRVRPEHLLLGLVRRDGEDRLVGLERIGVEPVIVRRDLEHLIEPGRGLRIEELYRPDREARRVMDHAWRVAGEMESGLVCSAHLVLGMLRDEDCLAARCLGRYADDYRRAWVTLYWHVREQYSRRRRLVRAIGRFIGAR